MCGLKTYELALCQRAIYWFPTLCHVLRGSINGRPGHICPDLLVCTPYSSVSQSPGHTVQADSQQFGVSVQSCTLQQIRTQEPDAPAHLVISILCLCFRVRSLSILCRAREIEFTFCFQICGLKTGKTAHLVEETVLKLISMTSINLRCLPSWHLAFGSWMKGFLNYFLWAETLTSEGFSMSISYLFQPLTETAKNVS